MTFDLLLQRQRRLWWDIAMATGWFGFVIGLVIGWWSAVEVVR